MCSTHILIRACSTLIVFSIGLLGLVVFWGNVTDYQINFQFVSHVMKMDTIFPDSQIQYRSIHSPIWHHVFYWIIIVMEFIIGILGIIGGWKMMKHLKSANETFHAQKKWGMAAIFLGLLLWFVFFYLVGGEWFAMWQSEVWNGVQSAWRIVVFLMFALVILQIPERDNIL